MYCLSQEVKLEGLAVEDILESEPSTNQAWLMLTSCGHTPTRVSVAEKPNFSWVGRVLRVAPCYSFKCLKVIIIFFDQISLNYSGKLKAY
jgi:hypothetical protein